MAGHAYSLRQELRGHDEDVRCVCACGDAGIATGSRDKTVRLWQEDATTGSFALVKTMIGHTDFVSAVAWLPAGVNPSYPLGAVVTGSRDTTVIVWNIETASPAQTLAGHGYQVTSVAVTPEGDIVSASLDKTIRVWRGAECIATLAGHEGPVQAVVALPNGDLLSGAGDCTIKLWRAHACLRTFQAHGDTVRGLALVPGLGVVSASHDFTLKLWSFDGDELAIMAGHSAIIYSAAGSTAGLLASASEDGTARLWQGDGSCIATLDHGQCVWDVAFLPTGDLVTACSDYVARVWTLDPAKSAGDDVAAAFAAGVAGKREAAAASQGGGGGEGQLPDGLKMEDPSALLTPGTQGETKIIREGGGGWAYSWDATKQEWEKIGQVVDGPGDAGSMGVGSKMLNGVQYDFVFDVDIEDGAPPRKLPFNRGQNPYDVAERWLQDEELPASYREQVVNFIVQNTGGTAAMPAPASYNVDPFTGGGSYVPGAGGGYPQPGVGGGGGGGEYSATGGGADPFTGVSARPAGGRQLAYCPMKTTLVFDAAQLDGIRKKIGEFNGAVPPSSALAADEVGTGLATLCDALNDRGVLAGGSLPSLPVVEKLLTWPAENLFPVLDLVRVMALNPAAAGYLEGRGPLLAGAVARAAASGLAPNLLTGARLVANACKGGLKAWARENRAGLLDALARCCSSENKNVRIAFATALLNLAVLCTESADEEGRTQCLSAAVELLNASLDEPESSFRALVAVGTVAHGDSGMKSLARDMGAGDIAKSAKLSPVAKLAGAAMDVEQILT